MDTSIYIVNRLTRYYRTRYYPFSIKYIMDRLGLIQMGARHIYINNI